MRTAARKDSNQAAIVAAFEAAGATVWPIGLPVDLLVGYRGCNLLVECKNGALKPSARKLTKLQSKFMEVWRGHALVVESAAQASGLIESLRVSERQC